MSYFLPNGITHSEKNDRGLSPLSGYLGRRIQHILNENPITPGRIVHQNMGHCADQLAVLYNGAAAHE